MNNNEYYPHFPTHTVTCGHCGGRGIDEHGCECRYCDCGMVDGPHPCMGGRLVSDFIAAKETGFDWSAIDCSKKFFVANSNQMKQFSQENRFSRN
jgi:hypothetical protein